MRRIERLNLIEKATPHPYSYIAVTIHPLVTIHCQHGNPPPSQPSPSSYIHHYHRYIHRHQVTSIATMVTCTSISIRLHPLPSSYIHRHQVTSIAIKLQCTSIAIRLHPSPPWLHPSPSSCIHCHHGYIHCHLHRYIRRHQVTSIAIKLVTSIAIGLHPSPPWLHPLPSAPLYSSPSSYIHRHQVTSIAIKLVTSITIRLCRPPSS